MKMNHLRKVINVSRILIHVPCFFLINLILQKVAFIPY